MPKISSKFIQVHIARYDEKQKDYMYLVLKRAAHVIPFPGMWQVVTGNIEPDEPSTESAMREVAEETGLKPGKIWTIPYVTTFFNPNNDTIYMSPVFGVLTDSKKIILSDEHSEYKWLRFQECMDILELPTHREATTVFRDYILKSDNDNIFDNSPRK